MDNGIGASPKGSPTAVLSTTSCSGRKMARSPRVQESASYIRVAAWCSRASPHAATQPGWWFSATFDLLAKSIKSHVDSELPFGLHRARIKAQYRRPPWDPLDVCG